MEGEDGAEVSVVTDPRLREYDFGPTHPFQMASRWLGVRLLEAEGFFDPRFDGRHHRLSDVPRATRAELLRFHRAEYLDRVDRAGDDASGGYLDQGDTPAFPGCYQAAARVAGATLAAMARVLDARRNRGFQPGGGLHHAHPARASGFCIFNDVALAVGSAIGTHRVPRVAYVDIDAHHGDGVMYGFYDDGRVLDIDFHQDGRTIFPGTGRVDETGTGDGAGLKVNVPMPPGSGDRVFGPVFRRVVPPMLRTFRPGLIVLQCGVDAHAGDGLAQLALTPSSYRLAVESLAGLADELCDGRLLVTGGGGYDAGNVARTLGRIPWWLDGRNGPVDPTFPEAWRSEFEELTGTSPPDDGPVVAEERADAGTIAERLVGGLSAALGRSFPAEGPVTR